MEGVWLEIETVRLVRQGGRGKALFMPSRTDPRRRERRQRKPRSDSPSGRAEMVLTTYY